MAWPAGKCSKRTVLGAAVGVLALAGVEARAQVDCNMSPGPPNPIQERINVGDGFIPFTGTCTGNVFIARSNVTLQGVGENLIFGEVVVQGAQRVFFFDVVINAPDSGVFLIDGAYVRITRSTIENTRDGLEIIRNSGALVQDSHLGLTLGADPALSCGPVCVFENSQLRLVNSTVAGDVDEPGIGPALSVFRDSSVVVRGVSEIVNTGTQAAIGIFGDSSLRQDNLSAAGPAPPPTAIEGGIEVSGRSYVDLRDAVITGGISLDLDSTAQLGLPLFGNPEQLVVDGGVTLSRRSTLAVEDERVTINGDVVCDDKPTSRMDGDFQGFGDRHCLRFSGKHPRPRHQFGHVSQRFERLAQRFHHGGGRD